MDFSDMDNFDVEILRKALSQPEERQKVNEELRQLPFWKYYRVWLSLIEGNISDDSFYNYSSSSKWVIRYFRDQAATVTLDSICLMDVKLFNSFLANVHSERTGRKLASTTRKGIYGLVINCVSFATNCGTIPYKGLEKDKVRGKPKSTKVPYNLPQILKILAALKDTPYVIPVLIMCVYGTRVGETLALCWDWVDFDSRTIIIAYTKSERTQTLHGPKTETSYRVLPLIDVVYEVLLKWKHQVDSNRSLLPAGYVYQNDYVCTGFTGKPLKKSDTDRILRGVIKELGLPAFRGDHCFRHSTAIILASFNVPTIIIQKILGHKNLETTENTYLRSYIPPSLCIFESMNNIFQFESNLVTSQSALQN